jgi:hydrogenase nickel incorporation protein HypA/HybF
MHEWSLMADVIGKIENIAREQNARQVVRVTVRLGALAHISADHFREHFLHAVRGTPAEGARLDVQTSTDWNDPHAQDIMLESVEVEH